MSARKEILTRKGEPKQFPSSLLDVPPAPPRRRQIHWRLSDVGAFPLDRELEHLAGVNETRPTARLHALAVNVTRFVVRKWETVTVSFNGRCSWWLPWCCSEALAPSTCTGPCTGGP